MQLKINLPDNLTPEKTSQLIKNIEKLLQKESVALEIENNLESDIDAWDEFNFENIAVDTGIEDFAVNHDRYLYKTSHE
ncbi:MAG: hypothetical protein QNJ34_21650 [Xenococcaceae cyanobacterium MO_188.B29]|nr:hypothetical protein [Xenococcaceae cyanobacterium MO_188.B29]